MWPSASRLRTTAGSHHAPSVRGEPNAGASIARCINEVLVRGPHLFQVDTASGAALVAGFVAALLRVLHGASQVMWVTQQTASTEAGVIYGPGLMEFGLRPERMLFVDVATSADGLWAMEEGLRSKAVGAVVGEFARATHKLDLTATRRLALRSEDAGKPAYLTAVAGDVGPTSARTRWRVSGAASSGPAGPPLLGDPTWTLDLLKNRAGPCGRLVLGFSPARRAFFTVGSETRRSGTARFDIPASGDRAVGSLTAPLNAARRIDEEDRR